MFEVNLTNNVIMYHNLLIKVSHEPTGLFIVVDMRKNNFRSKHKAREYATRVLKSKIAALKRGGYIVVNGELKEIAELNNPLTVETGTIREENTD